MAGVAVCALGAALAFRTETSLDLGFHLRSGAFILEHGWPDKDTFTYSLNHRDYLDSQWLFQVLAFALERLGGMVGLGLFKIAMVITTILLIGRATPAQRVPWPVLTLVGVIALFSAELRFYARPELISFPLLALVLHLLSRGGPWRALPLVMLVWANAHGLFAVGLMLIAARVSLDGLGAMRGGTLDRPLLKAALWSVAACCVNPYGVQGLLFPLRLWTRLSSDQSLSRSIAEFESPLKVLMAGGDFPPWWPLGCFIALMGLAIGGVIVGRRSLRVFDLVALALCLALALTAIRNLPLFAIAAAPWAAVGLGAAITRLEAWLGRARPLVGPLAVVAVSAATAHVVLDGYYIELRRPERFGSAVSELVNPVGAAEVLQAQPLERNLYNHLNFGGYLMWRLPERKVFIDGRTEVVGDEFFNRYLQLKTDERAWRAATAEWNFQLAIVPPDIDQKMALRLYRDPAWRLLFLDGVAAVFARDGKPTALEPLREITALRDRVLKAPLPPPAPLVGWLSRRQYPADAFRRGVSWLVLGELERAESWFLKAADEGPRHHEIWHNLGLVYGRRRDFERARRCFQRVVELDPGNPSAVERLGQLTTKAPLAAPPVTFPRP